MDHTLQTGAVWHHFSRKDIPRRNMLQQLLTITSTVDTVPMTVDHQLSDWVLFVSIHCRLIGDGTMQVVKPAICILRHSVKLMAHSTLYKSAVSFKNADPA